MPSDAVIIGSVGILTSGVFGPAVAARWARDRQEREFDHDQAVRRSDDLRQVLDDAAVLLGAGVTNLRVAFEAAKSGRASPAEVQDWASRVHLARERILLRLPESDPVVSSYNDARETLSGSLGAAMQAHGGAATGRASTTDQLDAAIREFETKRSAFLAAARELLEDPSSRNEQS